MTEKEYYNSIMEREPEYKLWRDDREEISKSWLSKSELLSKLISEIPADLGHLTVQFLNSVSTASDISLLVQDAPHYGNQTGYGIGSTVAQRILDKRATLNESKFLNLYQLSDIKGFSHDKLTDLVWSVQESYAPEPEPEPEPEPVQVDEDFSPKSGYTFNFASRDSRPGLFWTGPGGHYLFRTNRPIVIFIHGASGAPLIDNTYWSPTLDHPRWLKWNIGVFNWSDYNLPVFAYGHKAHELYGELVKIIETQEYDNNEIRFAAYSWGMHVACYAAAKLVKYINDNNRNIFVSVDLIDPVDKCLYVKARDVETNKEVYRWGPGHVTTNLNYVAKNQVVGMKPGKKLFTFVIEKWYADWQVLLDILPKIYHHVEVFQDGIWHMNFNTGPTAKYRDCEWKPYDETKIDLNNPVYERGPDKIFFYWIYPIQVNLWLHGPCQVMEGPFNKYCRIWGGVKSRYW